MITIVLMLMILMYTAPYHHPISNIIHSSVFVFFSFILLQKAKKSQFIHLYSEHLMLQKGRGG